MLNPPCETGPLRGNLTRLVILGLLVFSAAPAWAEKADDVTDFSEGIVGLPHGGLQPQNSFRAYIGQAQPPRTSAVIATGSQIYFGGFEYRNDGPWQFGASVAIYDDPPLVSVGGSTDSVVYVGFGIDAKLRIFEDEQFAVSIEAGIETVDFSRGGSLLITDAVADRDRLLLSTVSIPVTYRLSDPLWISGALGYTHAEDTAANGPGFGGRSFASLGFGFQPTTRQTYYAAAKAVSFDLADALDAKNSKQTGMFYTIGAQYGLTPQSALNLYLTNTYSPTPTGDDLSFFIQPDAAVFGVMLNYIPSGRGVGDAASTFQPLIQVPSPQSQFADGITGKSPHTLASDTISARLSLGAQGQRAVAVHYAPDPDFQFDFSIEDLTLGAGTTFRSEAAEDLRFFIGGRWQAMDEAYDHPFSLGFGITAGRNIDDGLTTGSLSLSASASKDFSWGTSGLTARTASYSDVTLTGIGATMHYNLSDHLGVMGEVTAIRDDDAVWSAGVRYRIPSAGYAVDLYATNAAGFSGLGALQSNTMPQLGLSLHWEFGADLL